MSAPHSPAEVLLRAADRVRALADRPVVVKLGGSAMEDERATCGTLSSVAALQALGVRLALVHGGGKPIDRAMAATGLIPRKVAGRRYTDEATLAVVVRVLGEINADLTARLDDPDQLGFAVHPSDKRLFPIHGEQLLLPGPDLSPVDLGHVGKPTRVELSRLHEVLDSRREVPIIPSLAVGPDGGWLNVNADTAASAVAGALNADACVFLTDTPGVLRDVTDAGSLLPRLTRAECYALIRDGVIGGGMVPKVEACFEALDAGAKRAVILDGRNPHALLDWFLGEPAGTEIVP